MDDPSSTDTLRPECRAISMGGVCAVHSASEIRMCGGPEHLKDARSVAPVSYVERVGM